MKITLKEKKEYLKYILNKNTFENIEELGFVGKLLINYYYYKFNQTFKLLPTKK